ncbi:VacB/RNase II family 3'-5' exoribonuclease [Hydrogenimonas cancrithermarum]|uniref:exoribonuclease II n=1 Tax=Hydrogenimonas cancrithermarum TaxID=2993563 RepID=A0ABN6WTT5_9BACT|nr:ribonuclease R family protein [Hydrogenimonas cancrithermarum]BDY12271.1 ribonuclease R [Hydrogenimonas cancrithermarum]
MRAFLTRIAKGAYRTDIEKEYLPLLEELIREHIVKESDGMVKLDAKYRAGTLDVLSSGTAFLELIGAKGKDLLIEPKNLHGAKNGDYVIVRRLFAKAGRPSAKVVKVVQPAFVYAIGYIKRTESGLEAFDVKTDLPMELKSPTDQLDEHTVFQVDNRTSQITQILGSLTDPKVDEKISLALFNKQELFSKEAEIEAHSWGDRVDASLYPDRTDLRHLPFCTIDPVDAKDFDDAIYWDEKSHTLYVAIADVSSYVTPDCAIDKEARSRGFSIYFPHKSIPMLPRTLSENICSLKPDVDRLAYVCRLELDAETLEVKKHHFFEAIIRSRRRYNYDEIDAYLQSGLESAPESDKETLSFIFPLKTVTDRLRAERLKKGYDFLSTEVRMVLDENHNLVSTRLEASTPSHGLIEDCMLLANKAAAEHFDYGIFRIHEPVTPERIEKLVDELGKIGIYVEESEKDFHALVLALQKEARAKGVEPYVDQLIIQAQKKASYSAENVGHFGLGFERYTHFTSPIRRYSDLTLHRLLKALFSNDEKKKEYILRNIEPLCIKISELEREATRVEWDFMARKYARWAEAHKDATLHAVVIEAGQIPAATTDRDILGMRIFCDKSDLMLFDRIEAKVNIVHMAQAKIFVLVESAKHLLEEQTQEENV